MTRLDKILSTQLNIPRTDAKQMIKKGRVSVNGIPAKSGDVKVADADIVAVDVGLAANKVKYVPGEFINSSGDGVTEECIEYIKPLIKGEKKIKYEGGMPVHITLE